MREIDTSEPMSFPRTRETGFRYYEKPRRTNSARGAMDSRVRGNDGPVNSVSSGMMRKLAELNKDDVEPLVNTGHSRWMIPYADLLTLLLGFFLVLFAVSQISGKAELEKNRAELAKKQAEIAELRKKIKDSPELSINKASGIEDSTLVQAFEKQLNPEQAAGINISRQERGIVISLKDSLLFEPGQADLTVKARRTLDQLAPTLNKAARPIRVEGHTDNTPITTAQFPSNWELSTARATNIIRYLVTRHGFTPDRLSAAGYGEFKPVSENSSIEGKQKNRRVDIVVLSQSVSESEPAAHAPKRSSVISGASGKRFEE